MIPWQPFWRNKVDVLLNLCNNGYSILLKRHKLPLTHLTLQLRPKLQNFAVAAGIRAHHVSSGRHDKRETKLIETGTHALKRNGSTMRFDFMSAGNVILK
jgi:hypothetical protein